LVISTRPAGNLPGLGQGDDLLLQGCADSRQVCGMTVERELGDLSGGLPHRLRAVAIRDDPVDLGAVELIEVAELIQCDGDLGVGRVGQEASVRGR
jgi:hypothetical protein